MGEGKVQSHKVCPTSNRHTFLSFSIWNSVKKSCRSSCLESQAINIKLKKNQQKVSGAPPKLSAWDWRIGTNFQHCFIPCRSALLFLRYGLFKIWPWKSKVKVISPWSCTTTGLDNSRILNGVNPSSGFTDMCSASLDPSRTWFDKFLAHGHWIII